MTNEERKRIIDLAHEIEHSTVSIQGEDSGYHLSEEAKVEVARCLRIVAGAKVEEGYVPDHTMEGNKETMLIYAFKREGITIPVRRYTFTEQLTTEQP